MTRPSDERGGQSASEGGLGAGGEECSDGSAVDDPSFIGGLGHPLPPGRRLLMRRLRLAGARAPTPSPAEPSPKRTAALGNETALWGLTSCMCSAATSTTLSRGCCPLPPAAAPALGKKLVGMGGDSPLLDGTPSLRSITGLASLGVVGVGALRVMIARCPAEGGRRPARQPPSPGHCPRPASNRMENAWSEEKVARSSASDAD